ncbi:MAG: amidohydrolase family protein [Candidatus Marinimicrobia bacterium]|nr:amidohydrolase family protein [Candidatus Neomarinimicrobiota bacterium]
MPYVDIIVKNAHIVTLSLSGEITDGTLVINKGNIVDITEGDVDDYMSDNVIDAEGNMILPGFIDCHTHLVHAGSRAKELYLRRSGVSYQEIQRRGGGIHSTVRATRAADIDVLYNESLQRAELCLRHGTTTAEIKTGYGLEPAAEKDV